MNIFEIATRKKLRFNGKGVMNVEDLWDLNQDGLNSIYKALKKQEEAEGGEDLFSDSSKENKELSLKIEIVRYIATVKRQEKEILERDAELRVRNKRIQEIIAKKEDQNLQNLSIEELNKMIQK